MTLFIFVSLRALFPAYSVLFLKGREMAEDGQKQVVIAVVGEVSEARPRDGASSLRFFSPRLTQIAGWRGQDALHSDDHERGGYPAMPAQ